MGHQQSQVKGRGFASEGAAGTASGLADPLTDGLSDSLSDDLSTGMHAAAPVQLVADGTPNPEDVHEGAALGTSGPGGSLPHADRIQESFGRFDVGGISSHTDGAAADATSAMGAHAFATGNDVAFAPGHADLHTSAHEAAHVMQQQGGVQLAGGVGNVGDVYEQHADAVADAVVAGESAEPLLEQHAGGAGPTVQSSAAPVQMKRGDGRDRGLDLDDAKDAGRRFAREDIMDGKARNDGPPSWITNMRDNRHGEETRRAFIRKYNDEFDHLDRLQDDLDAEANDYASDDFEDGGRKDYGVPTRLTEQRLTSDVRSFLEQYYRNRYRDAFDDRLVAVENELQSNAEECALRKVQALTEDDWNVQPEPPATPGWLRSRVPRGSGQYGTLSAFHHQEFWSEFRLVHGEIDDHFEEAKESQEAIDELIEEIDEMVWTERNLAKKAALLAVGRKIGTLNNAAKRKVDEIKGSDLWWAQSLKSDVNAIHDHATTVHEAATSVHEAAEEDGELDDLEELVRDPRAAGDEAAEEDVEDARDAVDTLSAKGMAQKKQSANDESQKAFAESKNSLASINGDMSIGHALSAGDLAKDVALDWVETMKDMVPTPPGGSFFKSLKTFWNTRKDLGALERGRDAVEDAVHDVAEYGVNKVRRRWYSELGMMILQFVDFVMTIVTLVTGGLAAPVKAAAKTTKLVANGIRKVGRTIKGAYKFAVGSKGKARYENAKTLFEAAEDGDNDALELLVGLRPVGKGSLEGRNKPDLKTNDGMYELVTKPSRYGLSRQEVILKVKAKFKS